MSQNLPTIAHFREKYLGLTETFIYNYLSNFQRIRPVIFTEVILNLDAFPIEPIHVYAFPKYSLRRFINAFAKRFFNHDIYVEYHLRKEKAKLIHAHFGPQGYRVLPIKRNIKLPLVTTFYGVDLSLEYYHGDQYLELFEEGELFLVEGPHMREKLVELGCELSKVRIQKIAIDVEKYPQHARSVLLLNPEQQINLLFCGRFVEKKGLQYALEAIKIVTGRNYNVGFVVIGDGRLNDEISNLIEELKIREHVKLLGYQPHEIFLQELNKADIFIAPSVAAQNGDTEGGAPTVLLEAQASCVPVVSTFHADIPNIVKDGETGFLVGERDSEALAERIQKLIENPELRLKMGEAGREYMWQEHDVHKLVYDLEEIYFELM